MVFCAVKAKADKVHSNDLSRTTLKVTASILKGRVTIKGFLAISRNKEFSIASAVSSREVMSNVILLTLKVKPARASVIRIVCPVNTLPALLHSINKKNLSIQASLVASIIEVGIRNV